MPPLIFVYFACGFVVELDESPHILEWFLFEDVPEGEENGFEFGVELVQFRLVLLMLVDRDEIEEADAVPESLHPHIGLP